MKKGRFISYLYINTLLAGLLLSGCGQTKSVSRESDLDQQLFAAKTEYIGCVPDMGKILNLLTLPKDMEGNKEGMELQTTVEPYGLKLHLTWQGTEQKDYENAMKVLERNAYIVLALVKNAGYLEYEIHFPATNATAVLHFDADTAKVYYGTTTFSDLSKDEKTFSAFLAESEKLFFVESGAE